MVFGVSAGEGDLHLASGRRRGWCTKWAAAAAMPAAATALAAGLRLNQTTGVTKPAVSTGPVAQRRAAVCCHSEAVVALLLLQRQLRPGQGVQLPSWVRCRWHQTLHMQLCGALGATCPASQGRLRRPEASTLSAALACRYRVVRR